MSPRGQDAQEDGLQDVLGVGRVPGDAQGRAEDRAGVALVQLGKPNQRSREVMAIGCSSAISGLAAVTSLASPALDAPGGRLLHGVREN